MATVTKQTFPYAKQQIAAIVGNCSIVVKFLCGVIIVGYILSFSNSLREILAVVPGNVVPPSFWYWTFVTHSFLELHIWNVVVDLGIIILYGKLLEPLWGAKEMLLFYIIVTVAVSISSAVLYIVFFIISRNLDYLFETYICGLAGYIGAFTVAVKQIMPDHILINSPFGKLRNKHMPGWMLVITVLARLLKFVDGPYPVMFGLGIIISWVYLRFYQKHSNGNKGDMAESFAFASLFPERVQPFVAVVSDMLFTVLVKIKICKKPQRKYDFSSPTTITVTLPGTDPQDAERRRQLALKALNERLHQVQTPTEWPSLDQEEEQSTDTTLTDSKQPLDTQTPTIHQEIKPEITQETTENLPASSDEEKS